MDVVENLETRRRSALTRYWVVVSCWAAEASELENADRMGPRKGLQVAADFSRLRGRGTKLCMVRPCPVSTEDQTGVRELHEDFQSEVQTKGEIAARPLWST